MDIKYKTAPWGSCRKIWDEEGAKQHPPPYRKERTLLVHYLSTRLNGARIKFSG